MLTKYKDVRPKKGVRSPLKMFSCLQRVQEIFSSRGHSNLPYFQACFFFRIILTYIEYKKSSRGGSGACSPGKFLKIYILQCHFSTFGTIFRQILYKFFASKSECFTKYDAFCSYIFDYACLGLIKKVRNYGKTVFIKKHV